MSRSKSWHPFNTLVLITIILSVFLGFSLILKNSLTPKISPAPSNSLFLYQVGNQDFSAKIGTKDNPAPFVSFTTKDGSNASFSLVGSQSKTSEQKSNTILYPAAFPDTDITYTPLLNGLKEEITISKPVDRADFAFNLTTNAHPRQITDDYFSLFFFDDANKYQFHLEKPFAIDAKGRRTDDVSLSLRKSKTKKGDYQIFLSVSKAWLTAKDRAYPITIDPTIVHDTTAEFATGDLNRVKDTGSGSVPSLETYFQELPTDLNLLGLYHFNNGACATDSSGNGSTLTANGGMTCATGGLLDYKASGFAVTPVSYSHATLLDLALTSGTIEVWINPANLSAVQTILYADSTNDTLLTLGTSGQINFSTSASTTLTTANNLINISTWTHVAATWTGAGHKIYVNGYEVAADVNTTTHTSQDYTTYIGVGAGGNTLPFSGSLDELRISKAALTPEQIKSDASRRPYSVYTSVVLDLVGASGFVTAWNPLLWNEVGVTTGDGETLKDSTSLVAQWNFNETSGTTADNAETTASRDLTLNNFASTASQDQAPGTGWTANSKRWGAGGLALSSVATADSLSVADPAGNGLDPNSADMTIETWINTLDISSEILSNNNNNGTACTNNGYRLGLDASGFPTFYLDTDGATAGCDAQITTSSKPVNDGKWHYIAVSVIRGTGAYLYVDGVLTGSDTSVTSYSGITVTGTVYMGGSAGGYDGLLDSTRVYSRALSAAEVRNNYQAGNIELQTRVGADTTPDDGSWEAWKPTTSETVIDNLDNPLDIATPSATIYSGALISTSSATFPLAEGTKDLKIQTGQQTSLTNLVALWHLDETSGTGAYIKDSSTNANNGTPTGTNPSSGYVRLARNFNGSSDSIAVGALTGGTAVKSVDFWTYPTSTTTRFIDLDAGTHYVWANAGTVTATGFTSPTIYVNGVVSSTIVANQWQHIAVTTGTSFNATNTTLGKQSTNYMSGKLDEMRVTTLPLSAEEISEIYRAGRDHYFNKVVSSTDLSGKTHLPFYVAGDRPGTYLTATAGESAFANYLPETSTLALWHLDELAGAAAYIKDSSGNSNHGTPTGTTFTQGIVGKARNFNGSSDYIDVGSPASFGGLTAFTISAWVYPNSVTGEHRIFDRGSAGNPNSILFYQSGTSLSMLVNNTDSLSFATAFSINKWHHVAVTFNGSGGVETLYLNGQAVATRTTTQASPTAGSLNTRLGCISNWAACSGANGAFSGVIDEIQIGNTARTAAQIRQAYEYGLRTHPITIDFASAISHSNTLSSSADLSFALMATPSGYTNAGDNIYKGDKIIVRENYNGTEYIAQGTVDSVNVSTGTTTVSAWDASSTFPSVGFSPNAQVFKWQREYWNLDGEAPDNSLDAITNLTLRLTDGNEGRTVWLDDLRSSSGNLTTPTGSTITSSTGYRYGQYRVVNMSTDEAVSATVSAVTLDYTINQTPVVPSLDLPADTAISQIPLTVLKTTTTDADADYLKYKIELCTNVGMTVGCQTFDQTSSQTGWSGQNAQTSTAYTSGTQAVYTIQSVLANGTTYYWRSYAIDPAGTNNFSATQGTPYSFTTNATPAVPSLDTPTDTATNQILSPALKTTSTDADSDYLRYKIQLCTDVGMTTSCQTFDQTSSQTGWSGQNAQTSTAYTSGTQATYTIQTPLSANSTYYWRSYAIDPGGYNVFSSTQGTPFSFTTSAVPGTPTLDQPTDTATAVTTTTVFKTTDTDANGDFLRYKIQLCTDLAMTAGCQTFDQTSSQTGWSGQNADTGLAYTSGTQATYTIQTPLSVNTVYYWRSYAIDPPGSNLWSNTQAGPYSYTTLAKPTNPSTCTVTKNTANTQIVVNWTDNSTSETGYQVWKASDGGLAAQFGSNLAANTVTVTDSTVSSGHTYGYSVRAYQVDGPSTYYSDFCYTAVSTLATGFFRFSGIKFN